MSNIDDKRVDGSTWMQNCSNMCAVAGCCDNRLHIMESCVNCQRNNSARIGGEHLSSTSSGGQRRRRYTRLTHQHFVLLRTGGPWPACGLLEWHTAARAGADAAVQGSGPTRKVLPAPPHSSSALMAASCSLAASTAPRAGAHKSGCSRRQSRTRRRRSLGE
jgi:hypothetical protein